MIKKQATCALGCSRKKTIFFFFKKLIGQTFSSFWNTLLCTQSCNEFQMIEVSSLNRVYQEVFKELFRASSSRTFNFGQYYCLFQFKSSVLRIIGLPVHPAQLKTNISASLTVESQCVLRTIEAPVKLRTTVAPVKLRTIVAPVKSIKNHC